MGLRALYERYLPSVWRFVLTSVVEEHAAQDVVSETFLAAVRSVRTTRLNGPNLGNWLFGIARNKVNDFWRGRRRDDRLRAGAAQTWETWDDRLPDAVLVRDEVRGRVAEVLQTLSGEERVALEWKYLEGLSVRQIATRLGRTEKAVEAVLYRARRVARAGFASDEGE